MTREMIWKIAEGKEKEAQSMEVQVNESMNECTQCTAGCLSTQPKPEPPREEGTSAEDMPSSDRPAAMSVRRFS